MRDTINWARLWAIVPRLDRDFFFRCADGGDKKPNEADCSVLCVPQIQSCFRSWELCILNYLICQAFLAMLDLIAPVSSLLDPQVALQSENVALGKGPNCGIADNEYRSAELARERRRPAARSTCCA